MTQTLDYCWACRRSDKWCQCPNGPSDLPNVPRYSLRVNMVTIALAFFIGLGIGLYIGLEA